jgi:hypothetical protein
MNQILGQSLTISIELQTLFCKVFQHLSEQKRARALANIAAIHIPFE